jgi:shikimate dehydrogenase
MVRALRNCSTSRGMRLIILIAMKDEHKLVASFGGAVNLSVAAAIHNAAFQATGINWSYIPFRADEATLAELFGRLRGDGLAGADFDSSCQRGAVELCDDLAADAELLQAVTTARIRDEKVEGFNVDVGAFGRALGEPAVNVSAQSALVLGVGAAARACGLALERAGANVTFAADELTRPRPGLSSHVTVIRTDDVAPFLAAKRPALLVDATTLDPGHAVPPPFDYDVIPPGCFVFDVTYDRQTPLLKAAEKRGLHVSDGLHMLLCAAERSFTLWTGLDAPLDVMRRAATLELEKRKL